MSKLISFLILFILTNTSVLAQGEQLNIDSLKRDQEEKRQLVESRKVKVDEAIKSIESSDLSEEEINRIIRPFLVDYNVNSYREFLSKYDSLLIEDQLMLDSIDLQILKIDSLYQLVNSGALAKKRIDSLKQENERLKSIMKNYTVEFEPLKSTTAIDHADLYYYDLNELKRPKIYFYKCPQDSKKSQYWKITAKPRTGTLITEAFNYDLVQIERFEEKFDSLGSKLVDYKIIGSDSTTNTSIEKDAVYLWQSSNDYSYQVKYKTPFGIVQFSKSRKFQRMDSLLVLGKKEEVLVFKGEYLFYNASSKDSIYFNQHSYYAKGIGFVKYERSIPVNEFDYEFVNLELEAILSKKEWKKLTK